MNRILLALMLAVCSVSSAQLEVVYPYNPDGNADSVISAPDLLDLLPIFGGAFTPEEVTVDGQSLSSVLQGLYTTIDSMALLPTVYELNGNGGLPLGTILSTASPSAPDGWMICDGREIPIDEFQELYDIIGTTYGSGDSAFWAQVFYPATTFNIPDLRGRTILGGDAMGTSGSAGVISFHPTSLGESGGEEFHQLTEEEMPSHSHPILWGEQGNNSYFANTAPSFFNYTDANQSSSGEAVGGDMPHNNVQPYLALNFIMKVERNNETALNLQEQVDSLASVLASMQIDGDSDSSLGPCQGELTVSYQGYDYDLVEIGDQCWFAENLRYLPYVGSASDMDSKITVNGYFGTSVEDASQELNYQKYGAWYESNVWTIQDVQLCPSNFQVPSTNQVLELLSSVNDNVGSLKVTGWSEIGLSDWVYPNYGATNATGFSAKPSGYGEYPIDGTTFRMAVSDWPFAGVWGQVEISTDGGWNWNGHSGTVNVAIRCIKDQ